MNIKLLGLLILFMDYSAQSQTRSFQSERITKSATIRVHAPADLSFPLFGPVSESKWAQGWNPDVIFPINMEVEEHMVFQSPGCHKTETHYTWTISKYEPTEHLIEYTVSTENRIWWVHVVCLDEGEASLVIVTYTFTGLNGLGNQLNKTALHEMFDQNLSDWEEAINYYLETGKQLHNK
jgi:hypothetical protein